MMKPRKQSLTVRRSTAAAVVSVLIVGGVAVAASAVTGNHVSAPTSDRLPAAKQAEIDEQNAADRKRAAEAANPALQAAIVADKKRHSEEHAREPLRSSAAEVPGADWPTGIFQDGEAPAPGSTFLATNRWVGNVDGRVVAVYAGRSGNDASVGRVLLFWADDQGAWVDLPASGMLRVLSEVDGKVTVLDASGGSHVLDVSTATWIG